MTWSPATYEVFADARQRPFEDLLRRVPLDPGVVRSVIDAGCGTGRTTQRLAARFPGADVLGVDASDRMLGHARAGPRVAFAQADITTWRPDAPVDVVVANAVLHWLPAPADTLRSLASWVAPGGCLAVQVPANFDAPSHRLLRETARSHGISARGGDHILPLEGYADTLEAAGFAVDAWETTYLHALRGPDAVLRWLSGTTLRPYVQAADPDTAKAFLADLGARLAEAYPPSGDVVRFPFTRRFVVALRAS